MRSAIIFAAQFVFILLLGLQQLNVVNHHYAGAAAVSLALGVIGFHLTATIAAVRNEGRFTPLWWSYIIAGPCGIVTAMLIHPILERLV
jgi:hypothetical protein